MAQPDAIDRAAIDELLESTGSDEAFLAEMIDTYLGDAADLLRALRTAAAAGDPDALRQAAHTLKSNSATLGARVVADQARALEERARDRVLDDAAARVDAIAAEFARASAALQVLRPNT